MAGLVAPLLAVAAADGVVEVVRGTVAGPTALAAVVAWAVAAAAVAVLVAAMTVGAERRTIIAPTWVLAVAATLIEIVLLLLDGAVTDRRPTAAVARLLLLVVALLADGLPGWPQWPLAGLVAATVPLGAPFAGGPGGVAVASMVALAGLGLAAAVLSVAARCDRATTILGLGLIAILAVPAALLAWPDPPPIHRAQLVVAGTVFDVTVAPVAPGRNELHLYARDDDGNPVDLTNVRAEVAGRPAQELFPVTPDHWLSYVLELPPGDRWRLTLAGVTTGGEERELVLDLIAR
jgi:hypothetical protein